MPNSGWGIALLTLFGPANLVFAKRQLLALEPEVRLEKYLQATATAADQREI